MILGWDKLTVHTKQAGLLGTDPRDLSLTRGIGGCEAQHPYLLAGPSVPPHPQPLCSLNRPLWFPPYHLHASGTVCHVNCRPPVQGVASGEISVGG